MKFWSPIITLSIYLMVVLFPQNGITQSVKKYVKVFSENFNNNRNNWNTIKSDQYQVFISQGGYYVLNRPLNSYYGYTRAGAAKGLNKINEGESSLLSFDAEILDAKSNGDFCFGITFDWHETPDLNCRNREDNGGDFYLIKIIGNKNTEVITANIIQRKNCEDIEVIESLRDSKLLNTNKIEIEKNNSTYNVIINGTEVISFVYDANFSFDNIYAEKGRYAFDNFVVEKIEYEYNNQSDFSEDGQSVSKPQIYLLLAGINHYDNPNYSIGQLTGPIKDITAVRNFYTSTGGGAVNSKNIIFLPDDQATADNILKKAAELFSKANQNDVIVTYLSGHGGVGYFCAYDQALQYERLNQIIKESSARKVFIVDACHAGSWNPSSVLTSKGERLTEQQALDLFYKQLTNSGSGINWILACRPDEYSADGQNNGLFTQFMLSGLKGAADKEGNDDNIVSLDELYYYVKQRCNEWNADNMGRFWTNTNVPLKMNPVLKSSANTNIPLAVVY